MVYFIYLQHAQRFKYCFPIMSKDYNCMVGVALSKQDIAVKTIQSLYSDYPNAAKRARGNRQYLTLRNI